MKYERPSLEELEIVLEGSFLLSGSQSSETHESNSKDDNVWTGGNGDGTDVGIWD